MSDDAFDLFLLLLHILVVLGGLKTTLFAAHSEDFCVDSSVRHFGESDTYIRQYFLDQRPTNYVTNTLVRSTSISYGEWHSSCIHSWVEQSKILYNIQDEFQVSKWRPKSLKMVNLPLSKIKLYCVKNVESYNNFTLQLFTHNVLIYVDNLEPLFHLFYNIFSILKCMCSESWQFAWEWKESIFIHIAHLMCTKS